MTTKMLGLIYWLILITHCFHSKKQYSILKQKIGLRGLDGKSGLKGEPGNPGYPGSTGLQGPPGKINIDLSQTYVWNEFLISFDQKTSWILISHNTIISI